MLMTNENIFVPITSLFDALFFHHKFNNPCKWLYVKNVNKITCKQF